MQSIAIKDLVEIFAFSIIIHLILYINYLAIKSIQPEDIFFYSSAPISQKIII